MTESAVTITEVVIHPDGDPNNGGALVLRLAPEGDYLTLSSLDGKDSIDIDIDDLPVLVRKGMLLLQQNKHKPEAP
jgi:hypothetical protein